MTTVTSDGQIEFRFYRPGVREVRIMGDFDASQPDVPIMMRYEGNGWWSAVAAIAAGDYRFRYFADGQAFVDYAATGVEHTKFGWNSILTVPKLEPIQQNIKAKLAA